MPCISLCILQMNQHDLAIFLQSSELSFKWHCSVFFSWLSKASCLYQDESCPFSDLSSFSNTTICITSVLVTQHIYLEVKKWSFVLSQPCVCICARGSASTKSFPLLVLNYFALDLLCIMNILYNLPKPPRIYRH